MRVGLLRPFRDLTDHRINGAADRTKLFDRARRIRCGQRRRVEIPSNLLAGGSEYIEHLLASYGRGETTTSPKTLTAQDFFHRPTNRKPARPSKHCCRC